MAHPIESGILRIINTKGKTIGSGFLVSRNLAVTCAHVALSAGMDAENYIRAQFMGAKHPIAVRVLDRFFDIDCDVAVLQVDQAPNDVAPLRLGCAGGSRLNNSLYTYGYASAAGEQGIGGSGILIRSNDKSVQFRMQEADHGHSGAPLYDEKRGVVIGMIAKGKDELGRNAETTFAIPCELIFKLCPDIHPGETSPYLGLENFTAETTQFFFGRENLTERLSSTIQGGCRFLAVFGPSGSGKSSVIQAGLLPRLKNGILSEWKQFAIRPTDNPFAQLKATKLEILTSSLDRIILFVDQFEELFTLCSDSIREQFVRELAHALAQPRFVLVIAMRDDFYSTFNSKAAPLASAPEKIIIDVPVALERVDLLAMMERPAHLAGLMLEEGLAELILKDLSRNDEVNSASLPLLEFTLQQLWERRRDGQLTHAAYQAIGAVTGSLALWAEQAYSALSKDDQLLAKNLFLSLVHLGDERLGLPDTRKRRPLSELDTKTRKLATYFTNLRLMSTSDEMVELIHDALLREWKRLQEWIRQDRDHLQLYQDVSEAAHEWDDATHDEALLNHRGHRLKQVMIFSKNSRYRLGPVEQGYLDACVQLQEKEKTASTRRKQYTIAAILGIILILLGWGWNSYQSSIAFGNQAKLARVGELTAQSELLISKDFRSSLLLAIEAFRFLDTPQTRGALLDTAAAHPQLRQFIVGHTDYVSSVTFSPDGKMLASGSYDGTIRLWDASTGKTLGDPLIGHKDGVNCGAFSPDGKLLASGSYDTTVILWDVSTGRAIRRLAAHSALVNSVVFNPDGKTLVSASNDATIIFWDIASGKAINHITTDHTSAIESVVFSPDGKMLASGGADKTIMLWDVATGKAIRQPLRGHRNYVNSVAFSPDGKTLASGSWDQTVILWDVATGKAIGSPLTGHTGKIWSVAFSPDGKSLVSGSIDNTIMLWDVATGKPIGEPLIGHASAVLSVAFSPNGKKLASGSADRDIALWDISALLAPNTPRIREAISNPLIGHTDRILSVAFSPNSQMLASGSADDSIILWNVSTRKPIGNPLIGHISDVTSIAFSPDGKLLASGGDNGNIILWDVATQKAVGEPITRHVLGVTSVAFSPNGKILASSSSDRTIILWNISALLATGKIIGQSLPGSTKTNYAASLAFSADGKMLASGNYNGTIVLWNVTTRQMIGQRLTDHTSFVKSVAFSPDGKTLASGSYDSTIRLWDISTILNSSSTGKPISQLLAGHTAGVSTVAFSPDGHILASGSDDGTIILWDVATQKPIGRPLAEYADPITTIAFSPNGKILASGSLDQTILLRDVDLTSWISKSCQRVGGNFTQVEWKTYFPNEDYRVTCPQWREAASSIPTP